MCKIAAVAIISRISIFGTALYPSFHNILSSYFPEQTNAILMRQAVFFIYYKKRNKIRHPVHHYIPIYIILKHGILLSKKEGKNTFTTFKKHSIAFTYLVNMSNLITK